MICSYCKTETLSTEICDFCKADLTQPRPKINNFLDELDTLRTQPELARMHTYDLLRILAHLRAFRTIWYKNMQLVRKAPREAKIDPETIDYAVDEYKRVTAQKNVIEQILIDRMGYFPKRIDDKLLLALKSKIERCEYEEAARSKTSKRRGI